MSSIIIDCLAGGASGVVVISAAATVIVKWLRSVIRTEMGPVSAGLKSEIEGVRDDITALHLRVVRETGGNSNGLRQKLNEVGEQVASLKGAFDQHIRENNR